MRGAALPRPPAVNGGPGPLRGASPVKRGSGHVVARDYSRTRPQVGHCTAPPSRLSWRRFSGGIPMTRLMPLALLLLLAASARADDKQDTRAGDEMIDKYLARLAKDLSGR